MNKELNTVDHHLEKIKSKELIDINLNASTTPNEPEFLKCDKVLPPSKIKTVNKSKLKIQIEIEDTKTLLNLLSNDIEVKDENKDNLVKEEITKLNYLKKLS